ncbi:serine/threonine-protein phosphatase with EF-hands 2 [Bombina bombina]|uniref:serine/threonine-protein phosphatase with EF-hands 2 n=1 Tax=Bombina bombina TaxID=8345 RepID=UPI00235AAE0E|nr:serine/threonine-protein phosphatase with EF-hands 2 [Bombina bombina]
MPATNLRYLYAQEMGELLDRWERQSSQLIRDCCSNFQQQLKEDLQRLLSCKLDRYTGWVPLARHSYGSQSPTECHDAAEAQAKPVNSVDDGLETGLATEEIGSPRVLQQLSDYRHSSSDEAADPYAAVTVNTDRKREALNTDCFADVLSRSAAATPNFLFMEYFEVNRESAALLSWKPHWIWEISILNISHRLTHKREPDSELFQMGPVQQPAVRSLPKPTSAEQCVQPHSFKSAVLIQRWYRRYIAQMEVRRRCTWSIFQSIEYTGEQDQIKLCDFFNFLMDHFTPGNTKERDFICRMFTEEETYKDTELEKYCDYESIEVPESYTGPRLNFPISPSQAANLVEAFKKKHHLHARYVLNLLHETKKHLKQLPNIKRVSTSYSKEITICGDLHGRLDDLFLIFYKNGLPSPEKPYIFNGDFVDRGKQSIEILMILFAFMLVYPRVVHLNRGNHEDYMVNLRYGFTKEVMKKYKVHGKKILKMLQSVFCWLPLATLIDQKVLVTHGGISDTTDLELLSKIERHKFASTLRPHKRKEKIKEIKEKTETKKCANGDNNLIVETYLTAQRSGSFSYSSSPSMLPSNYKGKRSASSPTNMTIDRREISRRVRQSVNEELEKCRRQVGFTENYAESESPSSASESESAEIDDNNMNNEERKQIVDILWSDPMAQEGCKSNTIRGGGCYFGPDVTEKILRKHDLQLLIRSHECKQEGYEFCHGGKVLTIFSASNYYEVGSNKGAYVKLGPDLVPHFVQYQANKTTNTLTMRQRISAVEESALRALREKLFAHKSDLINSFKVYDKDQSGFITFNDWATALESVLHLGLPWRMLRPQLVRSSTEGLLRYKEWFDELAVCQPIREHLHASLLEALYRNRSDLETIFRIIDSDSSGFISFEEFHHTWKLLSSHLNIEVSDEEISNMARSIDFNKDGNIDINEFLEAFRLVDRCPNDDRDAEMP